LGSTSGIRAFALRNFDLEVMEFESAQSNTTAKLPILKLAQENGTSVTKMLVPVTAEEKTNKKNDVKARSLLLMSLPNCNALEIEDPMDRRGVEIHRRMGLLWLVVVPVGDTIVVGDETIEYTIELMTKLMLDLREE
ncbi:hypothetical protein Tco_1095983, partial [Tanacetum coccineum]